MKKLTAILCLVAIVLFGTITFACAAQKKTDKMKVEPFTKIELGVGITASYVQGPFAPLKFTGSREALDRIMVTTSHGTLEIKYRNKGQNSNNGRNNVQVTIQAPEITSFDLATGAVLNIPDGICTQNKLSFDLSTGAVATIKGITATKL